MQSCGIFLICFHFLISSVSQQGHRERVLVNHSVKILGFTGAQQLRCNALPCPMDEEQCSLITGLFAQQTFWLHTAGKNTGGSTKGNGSSVPSKVAHFVLRQWYEMVYNTSFFLFCCSLQIAQAEQSKFSQCPTEKCHFSSRMFVILCGLPTGSSACFGDHVGVKESVRISEWIDSGAAASLLKEQVSLS